MITLPALIHFMGKSLRPIFDFIGLTRSGQTASLEALFSVSLEACLCVCAAV